MGTVKMSGEVSRSRQKKAAASTAKKGQNGQNGQNGSQAPAGSSKSSAFMKEQKKKSKDRNNQNKNKMPAKAKSSADGGFLSSTTILIVLVALTGVSVASYHQYPEKVQAVYEFLPPQVIVAFATVKDTTVQYGGIVVGKSADLILDGVDLAGDGY